MFKLIRILIRNFFSFGKKHFLLIFQNTNELRATGGYITQVIDLEIGRFWLKKRVLDIDGEIAQHKYFRAPKVIEEMLFGEFLKTWTFRDANFDPDFSKSAEQLIKFYNEVFPKNKIAGLLAINFSFVEKLVGIIGPLKLKGVKIDENNLFHFLSAHASDVDRFDLKSTQGRKNVLTQLMKKMIFNFLFKFWRWPHSFLLLKKGFITKDLQLYAPGDKRNRSFGPKPNQDFLAVIESNFLGLKSNRYIRRSLFHDTHIDEEGVTNEVRIMWEHFGSYNYPLSGYYRGHVRLYLPKDSFGCFSITEPDLGKLKSYKKDDLRIVEFKLRFRPQEKQVVYLKFKLPKDFVEKKNYDFKFFKQSGVQNESLKKTIYTPSQFSFHPNPEGDVRENVFFKDCEAIQEDLDLSVAFEKNTNPPRICLHNLIDPETILIEFNEPIHLDGDWKGHFEVCQRDNPEKKYKVSSVEVKKQSKLVIKVKGLPHKPETFYRVHLKGVRNQNNVSISPNPRIVTVIFRPRYFRTFP